MKTIRVRAPPFLWSSRFGQNKFAVGSRLTWYHWPAAAQHYSR